MLAEAKVRDKTEQGPFLPLDRLNALIMCQVPSAFLLVKSLGFTGAPLLKNTKDENPPQKHPNLCETHLIETPTPMVGLPSEVLTLPWQP